MLGVSELPDDLQIILNKADERIRQAKSFNSSRGGLGLYSRQSIAAIIAAWEMRTYTGALLTPAQVKL